jgi:lipid-binding SYLF domain-containing protein
MRGAIIAATVVLMGTAAAASPSKNELKRVADAATAIREIRSAPDGIPDNIWQHARCIAVLPEVKKAAFLVGGEFGRGIVSCRTAGSWSAPVFLALEKGSFGAQIGAESTDLVLLIMNEHGIDRLLQDKVTLGADVSLAAGPVGRSGAAATDAQITAEILSYSRSKGLFAGIDLSGGTLRPDSQADRDFYGHEVVARDILLAQGHVAMPTAARPFITALDSTPRPAMSKHGA